MVPQPGILLFVCKIGVVVFFLYTRNFPIAIWIAITMVTISYVLVNVGFLTVLSPDEVVKSNAVAVVCKSYDLRKYNDSFKNIQHSFLKIASKCFF